MSALAAYAITTTYGDVAALIKETVWKFHARYGGDFEEMQAEANLVFADRYYRFDRCKAQFTTYLRYSIEKHFLEKIRRQTYYKDRRRFDLDHHEPLSTQRYWFLTDFVDGLTEDAKTLVMLTLDRPAELRLALATRKGQSSRTIRASLVDVLKDWGWTAARITDSFQEIKEALQ